MAYTVRLLVTNAWYLSGAVARRLQTPTGDQITEGFNLLNALLAIKTANNRLIPYYTLVQIAGVIGQEIYFVPNLISVETLTFNIGSVRYSLLEQDRTTYFGTPRVDNIQALPYSYHVERAKGGANVYLYFTEAGAYPLNLMGKFGLMSVTSLDQDLSLTYDAFYIEYLRYALAEYMAADYGITLQPQIVAKLNEYEQIITDISPMDFTIQKLSTLQKNQTINYMMASLNSGWLPG